MSRMKPVNRPSLLGSDEIISRAQPAVHATGVYFLINAGEIVYIGQSVNVYARVYQHRLHHKKEFDSFAYVECARDELDVIESAYIHTMRPPQNGQQSSRGEGMRMAAPLTLEQLIARGALVIA